MALNCLQDHKEPGSHYRVGWPPGDSLAVNFQIFFKEEVRPKEDVFLRDPTTRFCGSLPAAGRLLANLARPQPCGDQDADAERTPASSQVRPARALVAVTQPPAWKRGSPGILPMARRSR